MVEREKVKEQRGITSCLGFKFELLDISDVHRPVQKIEEREKRREWRGIKVVWFLI